MYLKIIKTQMMNYANKMKKILIIEIYFSNFKLLTKIRQLYKKLIHIMSKVLNLNQIWKMIILIIDYLMIRRTMIDE